MKIAFNNSTRKHYLRVDEEKLKECDQCSLFNKCMFIRYNELMQEMLKIIDEKGNTDQRNRF